MCSSEGTSIILHFSAFDIRRLAQSGVLRLSHRHDYLPADCTGNCRGLLLYTKQVKLKIAVIHKKGQVTWVLQISA